MSAPRVYRSVKDLKGLSLKSLAPMAWPKGILMCPPEHYDVVDVKNPFMSGHVGRVDRALARRQWDELRSAFQGAGAEVSTIAALPKLEDMVFCANQTFVGLDGKGHKVCLLGQMRHPSRRREVPAFETHFQERGYRIARLKERSVLFEGAGDALWHPGRRLIWGGHGFRSEPEAYGPVSAAFDAPVILLKLVNERFYHLDTCFCPLTPDAVLVYPSAFDGESLELILKMFPVVLTANEAEAVKAMACNAAVLEGRTAVLQKGAEGVKRHMQVMGLKVVEVDTSEFMKSGGSVYCLKMFTY